MAIVIGFLCLLPLQAKAQSCFDVWMPTEVQYLPPAHPGEPALLSFGPPTCPWAVGGGLAPPEVIVSGSDISVWALIMDTSGMGVSLPLHRIEIETALLAPGNYQVHANFELLPGPNLFVSFPLVVPTGSASVAVPTNNSTALFGLGAVLLLVAAWRLRGRPALRSTPQSHR